jgi:hypothetical protein
MKWLITGVLVGAATVLATEGRLIIGGAVWNAAELERRRRTGEHINATVLGGVVISGDVTPELADAAIGQLSVCGRMVAPKAVYQALSGRVTVIGGIAAHE